MTWEDNNMWFVRSLAASVVSHGRLTKDGVFPGKFDPIG
jgi:hypothetical protein